MLAGGRKYSIVGVGEGVGRVVERRTVSVLTFILGAVVRGCSSEEAGRRGVRGVKEDVTVQRDRRDKRKR